MYIKTKPHVAKIFDNNLVAIGKSKASLNLNITAYIAMCIFEFSKVLM